MRLLHRISLPLIFLVLLGLLSANTVTAKCIYLQPVKIKKMDVGNMLSWSTYKETDNKLFIIEKSLDGIEFRKAGKVEGAGYSNEVKTYRFLDFSIGEKKVFYRILHYSSSGSSTMSETFLCERTSQNNLMITSMSSTTTDKKLSLTVKSSLDTIIAFEFKNSSNGKVITRGKKSVTKGLNALSFDCSKLPNGKYEVVLKSSTEVEKILIRKVKTSEMPKLDYEVIKK